VTRLKRIFLPAMVFALALASTAWADINYNVNQTVGAGGVTGVIVTDGAVGPLSMGDVLSWNLILNDGTGTVNLTNSNSNFGDLGNNLTATPNLLQFNFNGDGNFMNFFVPGCASEWSFETIGSGTGCNGTTGNEEGVLAVGPTTFQQESGEVTVGTAGTTAATPEPSYGIVTLIGLVLLVSLRKRIVPALR
jgi:hypothetical protein